MPTLTGRLIPYGPIIDLKVMQTPQRVAALKRAGQSYTSPVSVTGLIDTGASGLALDFRVISGLGLQYRGVAHIHTPSTGPGYEDRDEYDASIVLGEGTPGPLVVTLPVVSCDFASQGFLALIGRELLRHCVFTYDGPKDAFTLDF